MDYDGQRLLDVINDPNALESFLGGSAANSGNGVVLESSSAITQQQLATLQQQIQQQQQQLQQLQHLQQQQQLHSPFSVPVRSPAPSPAATVILRSPAAAAPHPASPSSSHASSPAASSLGHAFSVSSPAPAPSPGPQQQFYRAAPSPQQQRSGSLSSTPVASPINYPPGPGPGAGQTSQTVQLPAGTITIPALATAVGQVQQIVSGGQVLQILSASPNPTAPQVSNTSPAVVRHPVASARPKQPQLRPKPANSAASSPSPAQQATSVSSPRATPPQVATQQQTVQQQTSLQQQQLQQQQQQQQQQQHQQQQHQQQQQQQQQQLQHQLQQHTSGQVVQLGSGGPTGTLVFSGGNPMFPALAPTGGQFFLQQQGGGGFQLIVRPPMPSASPPKHQQQPQNHQQPTIVMQPQLGQTVQLNHRPVSVAPPPALPQQPMVRLVTLPGLGTVQLQQIQTPNGPAFLAVQQPQQQQQQMQQPFLRAAAPQQHTFIQQHHVIQQQQPQPQETVRLVSSPATTVNEVASDNSNHSTNSSQQSFAAPPKKPAKKKPPKKKIKKEEVVVEEKRPAVQVNLAELLKQTGIVDDDESFFMMDEEPVQQPAPPPPLPPDQQQQLPLVETKENNVVQPVDGPTLSETSIIQTLQQHGLALSADDLHTLRNFIKPVEQSSALGGGDSLGNGIKPAAVSLTLGNGQVIQLTEPFENQQQQQQQQILHQQPPKVQFLTTQTQLFTTSTAIQDHQGEVVQQQQQHGFQNSFLEDLARSQIVSDPKKNNKMKPTQTAANKKKPEPKKKKPPVTKTGAKDTVSTGASQTPSTPTNAGTVQRVQTIKLSPQNQQNLRNIQAQIQYLNSKKDPTPQDTSLLQKLIEHHSKILATGKPVPTIPGQHAQGVPFNASSANTIGENDSVVVDHNTGAMSSSATGGASNSRSSKVPVPANIQQNTHLANLLRQPVSDKIARVTTSNPSPQQPTATRFAQQGAQSQKSPAASSAPTNVSVTTSSTSSAGSVMSTTTTTTTQSTIQSPMGTLLLTVVDAEASTTTENVPASLQAAVEPSQPRGVKRQAAPAPKASISKATLFEHQLKTDQNGALAPDCKTPFKNKTNACKRLVRYHVFHELGPTPQELEKEEDELEERADQLITKFHTMINKYHHLLLTESTKEAPASEFVMVERMFVGEEKQSLERLKEEARVAKELQLTPVWPNIKNEPDSSALVNGSKEPNSSSEETNLPNKILPKVAPIKFTRKDGEGYRSELQEYKDADIGKSNGRIRDCLDMNNSVSLDKLTSELAAGDEGDTGSTSYGEAKPYDEWEAIQRELALYPESKDKDDLGFGMDDGTGEIIYDAEDIKAQMQNAIDDLLRLNGCDEGPSGQPQQRPGATGVSSPSGYDGFNGEMQVDLALNEAVNSIL